MKQQKYREQTERQNVKVGDTMYCFAYIEVIERKVTDVSEDFIILEGWGPVSKKTGLEKDADDDIFWSVSKERYVLKLKDKYLIAFGEGSQRELWFGSRADALIFTRSEVRTLGLPSARLTSDDGGIARWELVK